MPNNVIATAPMAKSDRIGFSISMDCLNIIDPNTKAKMIGDRNIIFASGARSNERKPLSAIADAYSVTIGSRVSSNMNCL